MAKKNIAKYSNPPQTKISEEVSLTVIDGRPRLNHLLRSRFRIFIVVFSIFAMIVTIRHGISASRGYALVATQNQAEQLELENERLRVEIAQFKSPENVKRIAQEKLGMVVPRKTYLPNRR